MDTINENTTHFETANRINSPVQGGMITIVDMVNKYSNDTELGEKIRSFVNKYYNNG